LKEYLHQIAQVIPPGVPVTAPGLVQNALQFIETSRTKSQLKMCLPSTVLYSVLACAAAGLDFINDLAFLVPFEKSRIIDGHTVPDCIECRFMPGYRGLINVAARHGYLMDVQVVYAGEQIAMRLGTDNSIEHLAGFDTTAAVIGGYVVLREKESNRVRKIERMGKAEIDAIGAASQSPVWRSKRPSDRVEMMKKTIVRRAFKWIDKDVAEIRLMNEVERCNETGESLADLAKGLVEPNKISALHPSTVPQESTAPPMAS
jgi:phage RecT family recombinase